jgi:hypothetical protein
VTDTSREALIKKLRWAGAVGGNETCTQAADMLEADLQPKQVTCQIYGHVVGACVECNTHIESQVPDGWDEAVAGARRSYLYKDGLKQSEEKSICRVILDMDHLIKEGKK